MTVKVGVIGAGIMGADHARTLHHFVSGAEVAVIADLDLARAEAVGTELPGLRSTADALALIGDPEVDAVVIASHDSTHAALTAACAAAGKPVLCEKPLAPSLAEATTLLESIGAAGMAAISLGFMRRFDPGYVELRAAIDRGELGAPLLVHCVGRGVSSGPGSTSASSITNSTVHDLDIVPWLLRSPVVEVAWHGGRQTSRAAGLQDPQLLLLRTADGVLTTIETFLNAGYGYDIRCEVVGETGAASLIEPVRVRTDHQQVRSQRYAADWRPRFADAYRLELQAWVDALTAGTPPTLATARDGLIASAVAQAAITAMSRAGGFVPVEVPAVAG